jgi:hypothetical protein
MIKITRLEYGENETIGVLQLFGKVLCYTLELPDKNNAKRISCIPKGKYKCLRVISPTFGNCWQVQKVPNRSEILIHTGNTHKDILGCILLGSGVGYLTDNRAVLGSKNAVNEFMLKTKGVNEIDLEIV